jgi:hypothetical protein
MPVPTTQEMLDNVRIAINARIVGGAVQSYTLPGGRSITSFSLTELQKLETSLEARLARESSTGSRTYAAFRSLE